MKTKILLILTILLLGMTGNNFSQDAPWQQGLEPIPLSHDELFVLENIPLLTLPDHYKGPNAPLLPISVDNSTQPYFRPITWQSGYECGQSASITFNFCYEIDRLRQVPANLPENQYPSHFTWNFLNNANNYMGVSFFDSWEIVRACGNMNVTDYGGGLNTGGYTRWISGYNAYYNGMKNRINSVKAIRVDTPEGLLTLKYWLYDHLEGSPVGGVGNIYAQYFSTPSPTLPAGTPEAGKYLQPNWGGSPSHAWTVVGFNDSIRYDFNGDGQFTNHIDITGDGVVDMHDWEIGGIKFANGYAGTGWGNSGFCYTMYKNLADKIGFGGIWNHTIYVIDVKATCEPKLTMKVTLKHTCRNKLKVTAGVSSDPAATIPTYTHEYPIFNYQGGSLYMQGGSTEADKTIEFGLDLTPLINQIQVNQTARYFLQVEENDPGGNDAGEIVNWALIDYTGTPPLTINSPSTNVPLVNNSMTRVSLNHSLFLAKPAITTATLPVAQIYQPYDIQLNASGGTAPYRWDAVLEYPETVSTAAFPVVTAQQLTLTSNSSGFAVKTLDFPFPYYKKTFNKIYVYADGYILFDDQPYTYPYLVDKMLLFRQTAIISPFMSDQTVYPYLLQGVWYEGNSNYAIIRWKSSVAGMPGNTNLNYAVKLFPNGTIEFYYGDMTFPAGTGWTGGISSGDNKNFQFSQYHNTGSIPLNTLDKFTTCAYPPEMEITEDGHFMGTPVRSYQNLPVKFLVTDNDNLTNTRTLYFNSYGLLVNHQVVSGNDTVIEYGETGYISLTICNIGTQAYNQVNFSISTPDPYITITDPTAYLGSIGANQTITLTDAFSFNVSPDIPDKHDFVITLYAYAQGHSFQRLINLRGHAPVYCLKGLILEDGDNGMLDAGETANLLITYQNTGSAGSSLIQMEVAAAGESVTVNSGSFQIPQFLPDSLITVAASITGSPGAPFEYIFPLSADISDQNGLSLQDTLYLFTGSIIEDFETGDYSKFPWVPGGHSPWFMEPMVKYEGNFSTRSGYLMDNCESKLNITVNVLAPGYLSFYKYVSCEEDPSGNAGYDYMAFFVDGFEMGRWDGVIPWSKESYWLTEGYHILSWVYHKDYSVAANWDGCLIDFVTFPLISGALPGISVNPAQISLTLETGQTTEVPILITNTGGGLLRYSAMVFDTTARKISRETDNLSGSSMSCSEEHFVAGQSFNWLLTVVNQSPDMESICRIKIDCPPGMTIETASNFSGGSGGELSFSGSPGTAATLLWDGTDPAGGGALKAGETAFATITGKISDTLMKDIFLIYDLRGDTAGSPGHHQSGAVKLNNNGLSNSWVNLTGTTGSLLRLESDTMTASVSTAGLPLGLHRCSIVVKDPFNNQAVIPVDLWIPFPVNADEINRSQGRYLDCRPNPFTTETRIRYNLSEPSPVTITIASSSGCIVSSWKFTGKPAGDHDIIWDGTTVNGSTAAPGLYIGRIETRSWNAIFKIMMIR